MRILLYTGKGGVGKTSIAAATALRCAELGYRTIVVSTDSAHSLGDSLDLPLGAAPAAIADNLWAQELDVLDQTEKHLGSLKRYAASVLSMRGLDRVVAEELTILPGLEELTSLIRVVQLYDEGAYDVIVMDCAPTGATLQLLTMPEAGRWYLERILPLERRIFALVRPMMRALTDQPIPEREIYEALEGLVDHLRRMQRLLSDRTHTSARLVLNPEKMVIAETRRAYMYLALYGYPVDALICNRVLPPEAAGGYLAEWCSIQQQYRQTISESFAPLPILDVPLFEREVVGLDMLRHMGRAIFADQDPAAVLYTGDEQRIVESAAGYTLCVPLPLPSGKIQVHRPSADELIVHIGNRKRMLSLPHSLAAMHIAGARHEDDTLYVDFAERSAPEPPR
ncbi:MAG TPA: ArsA family ATPase [Anaerolineae bacterium]|nr:ArsA family ATPase [Anaerolineae bacterium]